MPNTVCTALFIDLRGTRNAGWYGNDTVGPRLKKTSEHVHVELCMYAHVYLQGKQAKTLGCSSSCCAASLSVAVSWSPVYMEGCHLWGRTDGSQRSITQSDTSSLKTTQPFRKKRVSQSTRSITLRARRNLTYQLFCFSSFRLI